jgi:putative ABC transport system permease protein
VTPFRHDLRAAVRALSRRPGLTTVAVGTIAIAIAANTAIFSVVNGALLRPLPLPEVERLVTMDVRAHTGFLISLSIPNYRDWRDRSRSFDAFAASAGWGFVFTGRGAARVVSGQAVVGDYFGMFGMQPLVGRVLTAAELPGHAGGERLVVLGHAFWQQHLGADPGVVGQTLTLDGNPFAVVGVLPPGVGFPTPTAEFYVPMAAMSDLPWDDRTSSFGTRGFARLAPGVALAEAARDLDRVGRELRAEAGDDVALPEVRSLASYYVSGTTERIWILMGAVGFVLLIAVANVGNLLLARAEDRHRELAVRSALGAGRWQITRLLLTEAMVLAVAGGVAGAGLAYVAVGGLLQLLPADFPALLRGQVRVDVTVLSFGVLLALLSGVAFGIAPALRAGRIGLEGALKSGTRATRRSGALRSAFVVGEVALALVLLVGAGLMVRSLERLSRVDKGFEAGGVLTGAVAISDARYPDRERWRAFYAQLRDEAAELPGVRAAGLALLLPLSNRSWELRIHPAGVPVLRETGQSVLYNVVSPEYFDVLRVPILRGRAFQQADREGGDPVAIIDETMAERFWPGADPIGQQVTFESDSAGAPLYRTVVGVAANVRHYELAEPSRIQVYVPFAQTGSRWGMGLRLVLRTDGEPATLVTPLREVVTRLDPEAPLSSTRPLDEFVAGALAADRAMTRVLAAFGAGALALAALGIFGVMSYAVTRRTREIGIRMALGAARGDVLRWVGGRTLRLTLGGVAIGLGAAVALTRLLRRMLFEVSPLDPVILGGVTVVLTAVALLAAYLPARRATRVDPVAALNTEA